MMPPDQKKIWYKGLPKLAVGIKRHSDFVEDVQQYLNKRSRVLELGCGIGFDAEYLAKKRMHVIATDFIEESMERNIKTISTKNLHFQPLDISSSYPFEDNSFDCVYACLSLHYFSRKQTKLIFDEIERVLKPGGLLAFRCKSTKDPLFGQGKMIEPNMFILKNHIRHFFDDKFARDLLEDRYKILSLKEIKGEYMGKTSQFIDCMARKI